MKLVERYFSSMIYPLSVRQAKVVDVTNRKHIVNQLIETIPGTRIGIVCIQPAGFQYTDGRAIIFFHGNAQILYNSYPLLQEIANIGKCNVYSYDYPSFGLRISEPTPTEETLREEAMQVYTYVAQQEKTVTLMGYSLGSFPATYCAFIFGEESQIERLILISAYASILSVVLNPDSFLYKKVLEKHDILVNSRYLPYIKIPVIIMHGKTDQVVPLRNAHKLFKCVTNSSSKLIVVENTGHSDIFTRDTIKTVLEK